MTVFENWWSLDTPEFEAEKLLEPKNVDDWVVHKSGINLNLWVLLSVNLALLAVHGLLVVFSNNRSLGIDAIRQTSAYCDRCTLRGKLISAKSTSAFDPENTGYKIEQ
jgi:hypothetical protein